MSKWLLWRTLPPVSPPRPALQCLRPGVSIAASLSQNWFRTSADPPPRHKGRDSPVPKKERKSLAGGGKKRGRKPKDRPPEESAPRTSPRRDEWPPGGRDKGARGSTGRKVGAGKAPEK